MGMQLINENGRAVNNHFVTLKDNSVFLLSYGTVVCKIDKEENIFLDPKWEFSNTTTKYVCQFLRQMSRHTQINKSGVLKNITNGNIIVKELN